MRERSWGRRIAGRRTRTLETSGARARVPRWGRGLFTFGLVLGAFMPAGQARPSAPTPPREGYQVSRFDLSDPQVVLHLAFAGGQAFPNGPESFSRIVARSGGAVAVNGTYFNVRTYETFGNLVTGGRLVQHRDWDNRGTALVIGRDRRGRLQNLRDAGWPDYQESWLVLPAGPLLLRNGKVSLNPRKEGFQDPLIFQRKPRTALGLSEEGRYLWVVTIRKDVTLDQEARIMQRLGVSEALNLDGGTSVGLATAGRVRLHPRTPLTQALVVYDSRHPAPKALSERYAAWLKAPGTATPQAGAPR